MEEPSSFFCNLRVLDSLSDDEVQEILNSYAYFSAATQALLNGTADVSLQSEFVAHVQSLCKHGLESLLLNHFLRSLQENFEKNGALEFWRHFDAYENNEILNTCNNPPHSEEDVREVLCKALEEISSKKKCQEELLSILVHALLSYRYDLLEKGRQYDTETEVVRLFAKYQLLVSSVLMATLPRHFPDLLHWYFKGNLEELSAIMAGELNKDYTSQCKDDMELDGKGRISSKSSQKDFNECYQLEKFSNIHKLVKNIGKVVLDLRSLGFTSMAEDAYASAIFSLLKAKVDSLAGDDYRSSVLEPIKEWIKAVPLHFLHSLLAYLGNSAGNNSPLHSLKSSLAPHASSFNSGVDTPEGLIRWQSRLEYFAYETLQDLRIAKLFEIIVDYPDRLFRNVTAKDSLVCQCWSDSLYAWDIKFRRNFTDIEFDDWVALLNKLQTFKTENRDDVFGVVVGERLLFNQTLFSKLIVKQIALERQKSDLIWKTFCPKKVKVFLWIFSSERLNTCCRIQRILRSYALSPNWCVLCKNNEESLMHLFFFCPFAADCWGKLFSLFKMQWCWPKKASDALLQLVEGPQLNAQVQILWSNGIFALLWRLWFERNSRIFRDQEINTDRFWSLVTLFASTWSPTSKFFCNLTQIYTSWASFL